MKTDQSEIFAYSWSDYDETRIFPSLELVYEKMTKNYVHADSGCDSKKYFICYFHFKNGGGGSVYYDGRVVNHKELSENEIKEIILRVDEDIKRTNELLRSIREKSKKNGGDIIMVTGCSLPTEPNREYAISQEIKRRSFSVKAFSELDPEKFIFEPNEYE